MFCHFCYVSCTLHLAAVSKSGTTSEKPQDKLPESLNNEAEAGDEDFEEERERPEPTARASSSQPSAKGISKKAAKKAAKATLSAKAQGKQRAPAPAERDHSSDDDGTFLGFCFFMHFVFLL